MDAMGIAKGEGSNRDGQRVGAAPRDFSSRVNSRCAERNLRNGRLLRSNRRNGFRFDEVGEAARGAEPHAPVLVLADAVAVEVVPDQAVVVGKAAPGSAVKYGHA